MRRLVLAALLVCGVAAAQPAPTPGKGAVTSGAQTFAGAKTFSSVITSTVASGSNAFAQVTGAQLDLGGGTNDYLKSDGTGLVTPTSIEAQSGFYATSGGSYHIGGSSVLLDLGSFKLELQGYAVDGASAVGVVLNSGAATLSTLGAKLLSVRNNGTEEAYFDVDGSLVEVNGSVTSSFVFAPNANHVEVRGLEANGASAVGVVLNTGINLTTAGAKIASFRNFSSEKAFIDKDGVVSTGGVLCAGSTHCGTIAISASTSGTATVVTGCHPICTNTTSTNVVKCAVSSTTLTATEAGSSSDSINYFCF